MYCVKILLMENLSMTLKNRLFNYVIIVAFSFLSPQKSIGNPRAEPGKHIHNTSITIFAHGLGGSEREAYYYKKHDLIEQGAYAFALYDNLSQVSLGQQHEINNLVTAINKVTTGKPATPIVLRGVSMGAATIVNYLGSCIPVGTKIIGAILESPFAHVQDVLDVKIIQSYLLSALSIMPGFNQLAIYCTYKNHRLNGIQPVKAANAIPTHIPILLIASEEDTLITPRSTARIYTELLKSGHTKTHLFIVKQGLHANICWHEISGTMVRNVEHAFRKKYNLGNYNDTYALAGQKAFACTQPLLTN